MEIMNEKKKNYITIQELAYLLSFLILFGARAIGLYEGQFLYNVALVLGLLTWGIKILMTENTLLEYLMISFLILLTLIVYRNTGEKGLLLYFTMMLGMKNVSVKRVFKCGTCILMFSYTILVITSLLGFRSEFMYLQARGSMGVVFRHALGYPHPNTLHTTYVVLIALILYLVGRQSWKKLFLISTILFSISCYIYLYSGSRTGLLTTGIYLAVNFLFQVRKEISSLEKRMLYLLYPLCLIFSIIGPITIKGNLYEIINKILNNRWNLSVYYLLNEPVTLLGTHFKETAGIHEMIDSSFLYSFLQLGIAAFCIITFLYMSSIHMCIKNDMNTELALIVSFCIMGISDPFLFNLSYKNLCFLFIGKMIYDHWNRIENRLPRWLNCRIHILKVGSRKIAFSELKMKKNMFSKKDILCAGFLFLVIGIGSASVYLYTSKKPEALYVNQEVWEDSMRRNLAQISGEQVQEVYLTKEELREVKKEGNLALRYQNEAEPMYRITGEAAQMEYFRKVVSLGVWSGALAMGIYFLKLQQKRKEV